MTRALVCALVAAGTTILPAAPASGHGVLRREGGVLRYTAFDPGVGATLTISSPRAGTADFFDTTSPGGMDWGPCLPRTERLTSCPTKGVSRIDVEVFDGNDVIVARVGTPVRVLAGDGDDRVTAGYGNDVLAGGSGSDSLTGGPGVDMFDGADGADSIQARDGVVDQLSCGAGSDTGTADGRDPQAADCEGLARGDFRDRGAPGVRAKAGRRQRVSRAVLVEASMDEPGTISASGRILVGGRPAGRLRAVKARPDAPGQRHDLRLRLSGRVRGAVRNALGENRSVVASLAVRGTDKARNRGKARRLRVRIGR